MIDIENGLMLAHRYVVIDAPTFSDQRSKLLGHRALPKEPQSCCPCLFDVVFEFFDRHDGPWNRHDEETHPFRNLAAEKTVNEKPPNDGQDDGGCCNFKQGSLPPLNAAPSWRSENPFVEGLAITAAPMAADPIHDPQNHRRDRKHRHNGVNTSSQSLPDCFQERNLQRTCRNHRLVCFASVGGVGTANSTSGRSRTPCRLRAVRLARYSRMMP